MDQSGYDTLLFESGAVEQFRVPAGLGNYRDALPRPSPPSSRRSTHTSGCCATYAPSRRRHPGSATRSRRPTSSAPGYRTLRVMSATLGDVFDRIWHHRGCARCSRVSGTTRWRRARCSFWRTRASSCITPAGPGIRAAADNRSPTHCCVSSPNGGQVLLRTQVDEILLKGGGCGVRRPAATADRLTPSPHRSWCVQRGSETHLTELLPADAVPPNCAPGCGRRHGRPAARGIPSPTAIRSGRAHPTPTGGCTPMTINRAYAQVSAGVMPKITSAYPHVRQPEGPPATGVGPPGQTNIQDHDRRTRRPPVPQGLQGGDPRPESRTGAIRNTSSASSSCTRPLMRSAERAIPGISDSVIYSESATPITHERFVRSTGGTSTVWRRRHQMLLKRPSARTAIKGLWIVGSQHALHARHLGHARRRYADCCVNSRRSCLSVAPIGGARTWRPEPEFHLPQRHLKLNAWNPARMTRTGFHSVTKPGRLHARRHWRIRASR